MRLLSGEDIDTSEYDCHGEKPILIPSGWVNRPYPWHPDTVELAVHRIGELFILCKFLTSTLAGGLSEYNRPWNWFCGMLYRRIDCLFFHYYFSLIQGQPRVKIQKKKSEYGTWKLNCLLRDNSLAWEISNPDSVRVNLKSLKKRIFSAVPAELTTMAGRLLREGVRQEIRQYVDFDPTGLVINCWKLILRANYNFFSIFITKI